MTATSQLLKILTLIFTSGCFLIPGWLGRLNISTYHQSFHLWNSIISFFFFKGYKFPPSCEVKKSTYKRVHFLLRSKHMFLSLSGAPNNHSRTKHLISIRQFCFPLVSLWYTSRIVHPHFNYIHVSIHRERKACVCIRHTWSMRAGAGIQEIDVFGNTRLDQDLDRNRAIIRILAKTERKGMSTSPLLVGEDKINVFGDPSFWEGDSE